MNPLGCIDISQAGLAVVLSRALHDESNLVYMFPEDDSRRRVLPQFFLSAIRSGQLQGEIHTTDHADGVAVWIRPNEHEVLGRWTLNPRFAKLHATVADVRKRLTAGPHWYLKVFGVDGGRLDRSLGAALIQPVLIEADAHGVPCYLETFSEEKLGFFREFGFQISGAGRIPDDGPNFWAMTRQ
jgi:hypothetical protein